MSWSLKPLLSNATWHHYSTAPYYEKLMAEGAATKQRLEDLAKSLEEAEMSQCTFYPETLKLKAPKSRKPLVGSVPLVSQEGGDLAAAAGTVGTGAGGGGGGEDGGGGMTPGEQRYADLERELEAVLALDVDGTAPPMNAESLAAMLNVGGSNLVGGGGGGGGVGGFGGGGGAGLPDLSSDDEDDTDLPGPVQFARAAAADQSLGALLR
jgi:hypothetical protein